MASAIQPVQQQAMVYPHGLHPPSDEQQCVIRAIEDGHDVILSAVAGSGKTTTSLLLGHRFPNFGILLLTYNKRLKEETRLRRDKVGLRNMEVHSYHAMGVRYYRLECHKHGGIAAVVKSDQLARIPLRRYDVIIIDEAQDMTPLFYSFVLKILKDIAATHGGHRPLMVVVGDERQEIFGFQGADARFLTYADRVFHNGKPWSRLTLQTSYRVTRNIATFLNEVMLRGELLKGLARRIVAIKGAGESVYYHVGYPWEIAKLLAKLIADRIASGQNVPDDFFVLAYSVKMGSKKPKDAKSDTKSVTGGSTTPIKCLENELVEVHKIKCHSSMDDEDRNPDAAKGKVVISTFHSTKGLERPVVIIFGFDTSFFQFFGREQDPSVCPKILYVAATRPQAELRLVGERYEGDHLPFLDMRELSMLTTSAAYGPVVRMVGNRSTGQKKPKPGAVPQPQPQAAAAAPAGAADGAGGSGSSSAAAVASAEQARQLAIQAAREAQSSEQTDKPVFVSDLTSHMMYDVQRRALACTRWRLIKARGKNIPLPTSQQFTDEKGSVYTETVSDLNGLAIPAMLEKLLSKDGKLSMYRQLENAEVDSDDPMPKLPLKWWKTFKHKDSKTVPVAQYCLELAVGYQAGAGVGTRGLVSRFDTINRFDWIAPDKATEALERLKAAVVPGDVLAGLAADAALEGNGAAAIGAAASGAAGASSSAAGGASKLSQPGAWKADFEEHYKEIIHWQYRQKPLKIHLEGLADIVASDATWEVKCTTALQPEHMLQLAVYAWLYYRRKRSEQMEAYRNVGCDAAAWARAGTRRESPYRRFVLINVLTDEQWELDLTEEEIDPLPLNTMARTGTSAGVSASGGAGAGASSSAGPDPHATSLDHMMHILFVYYFRSSEPRTDEEFFKLVTRAYAQVHGPQAAAAKRFGHESKEAASSGSGSSGAGPASASASSASTGAGAGSSSAPAVPVDIVASEDGEQGALEDDEVDLADLDVPQDRSKPTYRVKEPLGFKTLWYEAHRAPEAPAQSTPPGAQPAVPAGQPSAGAAGWYPQPRGIPVPRQGQGAQAAPVGYASAAQAGAAAAVPAPAPAPVPAPRVPPPASSVYEFEPLDLDDDLEAEIRAVEEKTTRLSESGEGSGAGLGQDAAGGFGPGSPGRGAGAAAAAVAAGAAAGAGSTNLTPSRPLSQLALGDHDDDGIAGIAHGEAEGTTGSSGSAARGGAGAAGAAARPSAPGALPSYVGKRPREAGWQGSAAAGSSNYGHGSSGFGASLASASQGTAAAASQAGAGGAGHHASGRHGSSGSGGTGFGAFSAAAAGYAAGGAQAQARARSPAQSDREQDMINLISPEPKRRSKARIRTRGGILEDEDEDDEGSGGYGGVAAGASGFGGLTTAGAAGGSALAHPVGHWGQAAAGVQQSHYHEDGDGDDDEELQAAIEASMASSGRWHGAMAASGAAGSGGGTRANTHRTSSGSAAQASLAMPAAGGASHARAAAQGRTSTLAAAGGSGRQQDVIDLTQASPGLSRATR